ncbi:glycohydrolase toxin TNT-related protein, partial [Vibrio cincinnatiensis]|uniref:glycohydrolase toxin TNT-related protein n=1 Tax=Vibrio cincinnatiensis TaxID=675 RepID=UPI001EDE4389
IGLLGGLNHYQYAPNPVMWIDPTGLCAKEDSPTITMETNHGQLQQPIFYAMGSGNYSKTMQTASPTYQLHATSPDRVSMPGADYVVGVPELVLTGIYNTAVDAVAGLAGVGGLVYGGLEHSASLIQSVQDNYSYVPQSSGAHKIISSVSDYVESYQKTMDKLGDITLDNTGSPLAATLVQTSPELVTTLMGGRVALKSVKNSVVTNDSVTTSIREQVLANIAESKVARESSNFNAPKVGLSSREWPPFPGSINQVEADFTLLPGTLIDRFGPPKGAFLSPEGTSYSARALKPGTAREDYYVYEVLKPLTIKVGEIRPWFGEVGNGLQYRLDPIGDVRRNPQTLTSGDNPILKEVYHGKYWEYKK